MFSWLAGGDGFSVTQLIRAWPFAGKFPERQRQQK
jgi:hypothetical protein